MSVNGRCFLPIPSDSHFSYQNLPYGVFSRPDEEHPRVGVAIGDRVLDLAALQAAGLLPQAPAGSDADRIARGLPPLGQDEDLSEEEIRKRREALGLPAPKFERKSPR